MRRRGQRSEREAKNSWELGEKQLQDTKPAVDFLPFSSSVCDDQPVAPTVLHYTLD